MQSFRAATQYNDYTGTVAADRSDNLSFGDLLVERGLKHADEHVVGFEIVFNENSGQAIPNPGIVAFVGQGSSIAEVAQQMENGGSFKLRAIEVDLSIADFFRYFKRFNVMLSNSSLKLNDAEFETV